MSAKRELRDFVFVQPPEAPIFEPTADEFGDPFAYISKIRPLAEEYGICKIRPPSIWQPPFAVDVDNFHFIPRIQRINELDAKTRVKLNFIDNLAKFWELQGVRLKIPMIEKRFLDLYTLRKAVEEEGGFEFMAKDGKWTKVATRLGYQQGKHVASSLRQHYEKLLYPYDVFMAGSSSFKQKDNDKPVNVKVENKASSEDENKQETEQVVKSVVSPATAEATSGPDKLYSDNVEQMNQSHSSLPPDVSSSNGTNVDQKESKKLINSELKKLQFLGAGPKMAVPVVDSIVDGGFHENSDGKQIKLRNREKKKTSGAGGLLCRICGADGEYKEFLVCDECADAYHSSCLNPPLHDIPLGAWRCHKCIARVCYKRTNKVYGFEQAGREYSLQSFGEMADQFKEKYFGVPVHAVSCDAVEKEFWRLVDSIEENVVVEYGADNPAGEVGSGFPTAKTRHLFPDDDDYIQSPWNLNNIAGLKESLLHFINADISGMKVPWCYVGMCFSCFAWHTEDHWTYSINYLHWGEPKTWYGVPSSKAEMLEQVMKQNAPELFEQSPDLLHQLTTILNPNVLMAAGVPVYRTDQHAGEIIVTFPRGYHAGFNQGYNFAEAVNFCLADWLPMGRECIEHYRRLKRQCVFSHDELVCKMASMPTGSLNLSQCQMAHRDMLSMVEDEKKFRKLLLSKGIVNADREAFELLPDDERQCEVCKTTCFLSAVTCDCNEGKLVCIQHADDLCSCPPSQHCLRYRYTLNEMLGLLSRLKETVDRYEKWSEQVKNVFEAMEDKKHDASVLESLISEAREYHYTDSTLFKELKNVEDFFKVCNEIVKRVTEKDRDRKSVTSNHNELPKIAVPTNLRRQLNKTCFVVKEEHVLRQFLSELDQYRASVHKAVTAEELNPERLKELLNSSLIADFILAEEVNLDLALKQVSWLENAQVYLSRNVQPASDVGLHSIQKLVADGAKLQSHPSCKRAMAELRQLLLTCETLEKRAMECLQNRPPASAETLESLIEEAKALPVRLPSTSNLQQILKQAEEWNSEADAILNNDQLPWMETLNEVVCRGRAMQIKLVKLSDLETKLLAAQAWVEQTSKTFLSSRKLRFSLLEVLSPKTDFMPCISPTPENPKVTSKVHQLLTQLKMDASREVKEMLSIRDRKKSINQTLDQLDGSQCICKQTSAGNMVQCQLCRDLFHARCVSFSKTGRGASSEKTLLCKAVVAVSYNESSFLCPRCCRSRRPALAEVLTLLLSLKDLGLQLPEGVALQLLTNRAINWLERARSTLSQSELVEFIARSKLSVMGSLPPKPEPDNDTTEPKSSSVESCTDGPSNPALSNNMITALDALLVEGDLLEIDLVEKESLRYVLRSCQPAEYCLFVLAPLKFSKEDSRIRKQKCSSVYLDDLMDIKPLTSDSGIVEDIISISDDDDIQPAQICAAKKCLKPSGEDITLLQCGTCERWFHLICTDLDEGGEGLTNFVCTCCTERNRRTVHIKRPMKYQTDADNALRVKVFQSQYSQKVPHDFDQNTCEIRPQNNAENSIDCVKYNLAKKDDCDDSDIIVLD